MVTQEHRYSCRSAPTAPALLRGPQPSSDTISSPDDVTGWQRGMHSCRTAWLAKEAAGSGPPWLLAHWTQMRQGPPLPREMALVPATASARRAALRNTAAARNAQGRAPPPKTGYGTGGHTCARISFCDCRARQHHPHQHRGLHWLTSNESSPVKMDCRGAWVSHPH